MSKAAASTSKEVVYIDVDDEITAIIEKVTNSPQKIVALVLPKRSTTLQSVVNMKLLQRSATSAKKNVVLVTTDQNLLPLAGAVGLHVASSPQSKPVIPASPDSEDDAEDADFDSDAHKAIAVGALAASAKEDDEDTIDLDNESSDTKPVVDETSAKSQKQDAKKDRMAKNKVPNFNKFRTRLIIGGIVGAILLCGAVYAFVAMPYANITIATDTEVVPNTLDVTFDTTATTVSVEPPVVPSVVERVDKTDTQTVAASGERNDGQKATGSVTMTVNDCAQPFTTPANVPAGTGISTNGKNYITQESASFKIADAVGGCVVYESKNAVTIVAQAGGATYNVDNATFTVAGSDAKAAGSASGGTDDVKKIVTQGDIDTATKQLESKADTTTKDALAKALEAKSLYVIEESYTTTSSTITPSVSAGTEAGEVTVTRKTTNTMIGAKDSDLNSLITQTVNKKIDTKHQQVVSTGLDAAVFQLQNQKDNAAKVLMSMSVKTTVGPKLNDDEIKQVVAGKKAAEAEALIGALPGVTKVNVEYGPFWVSAIPSNTEKITIIHER